MEDGIREGLFRAGLSPEFIAKLQVGQMLYTLNPEKGVFNENETATIELFDQIMDYHMHAICTGEGLDYYRKQLNRIQNEEKD
jgi:hypothetical protein